MLDDEMKSSRAQGRGVSAEEYMAGNFLGPEVRARDVAQAFLHQVPAQRSTGGMTTVGGGNIAAALR